MRLRFLNGSPDVEQQIPSAQRTEPADDDQCRCRAHRSQRFLRRRCRHRGIEVARDREIGGRGGDRGPQPGGLGGAARAADRDRAPWLSRALPIETLQRAARVVGRLVSDPARVRSPPLVFQSPKPCCSGRNGERPSASSGSNHSGKMCGMFDSVLNERIRLARTDRPLLTWRCISSASSYGIGRESHSS